MSKTDLVLGTWILRNAQSHNYYQIFIIFKRCSFLGPVHTTPFLLVSVASFSYKNGDKNLRFCAFTLICQVTKTQRKTSVFVRSHGSVFVKLIVAYWGVFKNLRFCGYPLMTAFSKTSVFVAFFVDQCEHFHENGGFSLRFCTKTE